MSGFDLVLVPGASALNDLPIEVQRAFVRTNNAFRAPAGWREVPGAMHQGRNVWLIPVERVSEEAQDAQ